MKAFNISFEAKKTNEAKKVIGVEKFDFSSIAGKLQWNGDAL